jgi:hypothetical protein
MNKMNSSSADASPDRHDSMQEDLFAAAEHELTAFTGAVAHLFGADQARLAANDWLTELESMESLPGNPACDWRAISASAAARLAVRLCDDRAPLLLLQRETPDRYLQDFIAAA